VDLVLDGEKLRIVTSAQDQLNAERGLGHSPADTPVELGMRVWWCALRRAYPEHPCSKNFRAFVDALDEADEINPPAEDEPDPLDPTLEAGSDS
jgi:hypothetical protein